MRYGVTRVTRKKMRRTVAFAGAHVDVGSGFAIGGGNECASAPAPRRRGRAGVHVSFLWTRDKARMRGAGMARSPPRELTDLLAARDQEAADRAWERFLHRHGKTILNAAWCARGDYDGQMDRYAYILEELRREEFGRLRRYTADPRARFETWLTVVCRRLCVDYQRKRCGRRRAASRESLEESDRRRRLADLVAEELDAEGTHDRSAPDPEEEASQSELSGALDNALSRLEPEDRLLLRLRFQDELPARAVAQALQMPTVFHFYRRLNSILATLKGHLEAQGVESPYP